MEVRKFYTAKKHIPAFQVILHDDGQEPVVEFKNPRTKVCEQMPISVFLEELRGLIAC